MQHSFTFYGRNRDFVRYKGPESILHGPAETGKTLSALWYLHLCALKYPRASLVIVRKTLASTYATVLQTYQNKVLFNEPQTWSVEPFGGKKPEWFDYPNGARIWIAGLDKAGKILSSEHDIIYANQCEELTLEDWETLTTRTTGRAGNMPYSRTMGDCNPGYPAQWIYSRETLRLFHSRHEDNPTLYDPETGAITEQGQRTMAVLHALTGVRKERLLFGRAARPEGVVYENWDESKHLVYAHQAPELRRYVAAQDWGYTNPGCLGVFGLDGDANMYLVAQIYRARELNDWWVERAVELHQEFGLEVVLCDPSQPAYIRRYREAGLNAVAANNVVGPGIDAVNARLARDALFVVRDSLRYADEELKKEKLPYRVEDEFLGYVWSNKSAKEVPIKENDHGMDMLRYAVNYVDGVGRHRRKPPTEMPASLGRGERARTVTPVAREQKERPIDEPLKRRKIRL